MIVVKVLNINYFENVYFYGRYLRVYCGFKDEEVLWFVLRYNIIVVMCYDMLFVEEVSVD